MPTLEWIGKDKVVNHHLEVPYKILDEVYTYGAESSENKIIRGDNLEALKALLPQYEGRIKCIYIDPPYNTAKSSEKNKQWVYSDNVDHPKILSWIGKTVGDEGEDLSRHDKWLCMMYPRLKLLYRLLADDGIIFVSIDDNEQQNLRIICDEIFGKNSFLTQLVWRSDGNFDNQAKIKVVHEYILVYIKKPELLGLPNGIDPSATEKSKIFKSEIRNTLVKNGPKNPMSQIELPKGFPCAIENMIIEERTDKFPHYLSKAVISDYKLSNPVCVNSGWSSKEILLKYINNGFSRVLDSKGQTTRFEITATGTIEMVKEREHISHVLSVISGLGSTQNMSNELLRMGLKFDFPKPVDLIAYLLKFYAEKETIILDSFAGSGTTAHAVLNMNKGDGGNRKFILVEMEDYAENITAERVRCVVNGYGEGKNAVAGTGGDFTFYDLGAALLVDNQYLNESVPVQKLREYVFFMETKQPMYRLEYDEKYLLGTHQNGAYYFIYERDSITTLDHEFLRTIKTASEEYVIYADINSLSDEELKKYHIVFKKIPRDIAKL